MFIPNEDKILTSGHVWHGVAVGWHNDLISSVTQLHSNHERFTGIKLSSSNVSILFVSLYAPTYGKDDEFLECMAHLSEFLLLNISENDSIIIGADTNCSIKSSVRRQKAWKLFCESFSLQPNSGTAATFHHHNGTSESCIDTILTSKPLKLDHLWQHCTLEAPTNLSSHDALTSSISIPICSKPKSKYQNTYTKFNREKIIWDEKLVAEYQILASKALSEAEEFWDTPETIPLLCSLFPNLLVTSAKLVFELKKSGKEHTAKKIQKTQKGRRQT